MNKINQPNRTRDMETGNKLTAAGGKGIGDNGGKQGKRLVKEHVWITHGHGKQCGD